MQRFCDCKDCKRARRQGMILGQRRNSSYDAYVPFPKFMSGRLRKERNENVFGDL